MTMQNSIFDLSDALTTTYPDSTVTTITLGGTGASGSVLGSTGTSSGYGWTNLNSGLNGMSYDDMTITGSSTPSSIHVKGHSEFEGDVNVQGNIKIKGVDLKESLENIERRLNILHPNPEFEQRWDELRELGERYRQMEAELIEKDHLIQILKTKM